MRLSLAWRHFDRGSDECDRGQYAQRVEVFGGTGAGTLFALAALRDVAVAGNVFDPDFHSFREDAELAFRLQERGWSAVYEPSAIIEHRRYNLPQRRRKVSAAVNTHSLKNRYLLRILHQSFLNWLWTGIPATVRDLGILIYVLLRERSSLVAYVWLWQNRRALWLRRRVLRARRTVPQWRVERWFFRQDRPVTENR
jgi:GT2 family glycosyltransferase